MSASVNRNILNAFDSIFRKKISKFWKKNFSENFSKIFQKFGKKLQGENRCVPKGSWKASHVFQFCAGTHRACSFRFYYGISFLGLFPKRKYTKIGTRSEERRVGKEC